MKTTDAEIIVRVETVMEMILKGLSRAEIVRNSAKLWNIKSRQSDELISRAKQIIQEQSNKNIEENFAIAMNRYNMLFQKNFAVQDYSECRQVQQAINKLLGLDAPEKRENTNGIDPEIKDAILKSLKPLKEDE
jgi:hypothetical protein